MCGCVWLCVAVCGCVCPAAQADVHRSTLLTAEEISKRLLLSEWQHNANGLPIVDESTDRIRHPPALTTLSAAEAVWLGAGIVPLVNSLLAAGSGAVLVSLWKVDEQQNGLSLSILPSPFLFLSLSLPLSPFLSLSLASPCTCSSAHTHSQYAHGVAVFEFQ